MIEGRKKQPEKAIWIVGYKLTSLNAMHIKITIGTQFWAVVKLNCKYEITYLNEYKLGPNLQQEKGKR